MQIVDIARSTADLIPRHKGDGRPKIFPLDQYGLDKPKGTFYTRMTTFIDCLEDKTNLGHWKQKNLAVGLGRKPALAEAFLTLTDPYKGQHQEAMALIAKAEEAADADLKAKIGDALHSIIEDINRGLTPGFIPDEFEADIAAYKEAMRLAGLVPVAVETFVVNDDLSAGGSFDALCLWYGSSEQVGKCVPTLVVTDVKTGRIDYGLSKIGMQLGGYANAKMYDPTTYERKPITHRLEDGTVLEVDRDTALIIHLPAGDGVCSIVPVDIKGAYDGLLLARDVRMWRRRKFKQDPVVVTNGNDLLA